MDLLDVKIDQHRVVAFDGRVLEIFGGPVRRFHGALLSVTVSGPDKRGNRNVTLEQSGVENALPLDEGTFNGLSRCSKPLRQAGVNVVA